jgi:acyl-homoserine lactone acylase PvdQ
MRRVLALAAVAALSSIPAAGGAPRADYAAVALNVLPPGESGDLLFPPTTKDQLRLYDGLTPRGANVRPQDLTRYFKSERFGVTGKVVRTEHPRPGVRILRDRWDVPHIYGRTRPDVEFGAGYATAEDRYLLLELLRGPGRLAALDVPGIDPFALAFSGRQFAWSAEADACLGQELNLLRSAGSKGRQLYADVRNYVAGINAYYEHRNQGLRPWTMTDVVAVGALLGANLGVGGGDETRRAMFLDALQHRVGVQRASALWLRLAQQHEPDTPVSVDGSFPYDTGAPFGAGNVLLADGSFEPSSGVSALSFHFHNPAAASNALLVSARRSATHHPLFVAGPQVGYAFPEILLELDLHGGGIDARGASFPGLSFYVLLGRGKDFAWSATSANSDIVDHFVETLCGGDDVHYMYQGKCLPMSTFDAGVLKGNSTEPDRAVVFRETVHGPVLGYARTQDGRRVAISTMRSTRGRELLSARAFQDLNTNRVHDPRSFFRAMNQLEFTFNWFYADNRDIAMFSSGRLPLRADGVGSGLPTNGTGEYEWRGFEPLARHVHGLNPKSGAILNWNNKPGRGFASADDNWSYGPVQRVQLLQRQVAKRKVHTLATLVGAMNAAATQDLRAVVVLPTLSRVLQGATDAHSQRLLELMQAWATRGASRLDRNLDGQVDDPGAAVMDAVWPRIADTMMRPTLGALTDQLKTLINVDDPANPGGSSYYGGWYSYFVRDLAGTEPTFCGAGDYGRCQASLREALDEAYAALEAAHGPDPATWRADATRERLSFGFLPLTARWTNRPTFQQVITFAGHRPR